MLFRSKTIAQDPKGSKFWIDKLKEGNSKAFVVSEMLKAAMSNTYTKPEELKAQKLFLNKLKAAEIAHKAIENVPSSGRCLRGIPRRSSRTPLRWKTGS